MSEATRISVDQRQLGELMQAEPRLVELLIDAAAQAPPSVRELYVTCVRRTVGEEMEAGGKTGVHVVGPPWRACDISVRRLEGGEEYTAEDQVSAALIEASLKPRWVYDPARPALEEVLARPHGSGPHIHLQVSHATRRT